MIIISAATLQLISDSQAHRFRMAHRGEVFISIPMMEKRQMENKTAYAEYKKKVRVLI